MPSRFELAHFGELIADPSRAAMLLSLMDGQRRPASELAAIARVTPATASVHLRRLVEGRLLVVESLGRHRFFRIASDEVAHSLEVVATPRTAARALRPGEQALAHARTCYRHLAGALGVQWLRTLEQQALIGWRDGGLRLAPEGVSRLEALGVRASNWPVGKPCLDWTERLPHLGGNLGAVLTGQLFGLGWLARSSGTRALRVTVSGRRGFDRHFGIRA